MYGEHHGQILPSVTKFYIASFGKVSRLKTYAFKWSTKRLSDRSAAGSNKSLSTRERLNLILGRFNLEFLGENQPPPAVIQITRLGFVSNGHRKREEVSRFLMSATYVWSCFSTRFLAGGPLQRELENLASF